jgi:hypothetical protein
MKKRDIFSKKNNSFNSTSSKKVSLDQCQRKWQKLVTKYKEVKDHNSQTGNNKKEWKFLEEMNACLGGSPNKVLRSMSTQAQGLTALLIMMKQQQQKVQIQVQKVQKVVSSSYLKGRGKATHLLLKC